MIDGFHFQTYEQECRDAFVTIFLLPSQVSRTWSRHILKAIGLLYCDQIYLRSDVLVLVMIICARCPQNR